MSELASTGPLHGLRVLDLGHYYAGPMAAMLLADQGAEVVRVMRPEGPELPNAQHRVLNRNKKIVTIDLGSDAGRQRAQALAARADARTLRASSRKRAVSVRTTNWRSQPNAETHPSLPTSP